MLAVSTGVPVQAEVVMAQSKVETEARNKTAVQASFAVARSPEFES